MAFYLTSLAFLDILSFDEIANLERNMQNTRLLAVVMKPFFLFERKLLVWLRKA
jgi:hypothetical protein